MCSQETDLHLKHVITLFPHSVVCFPVTSACTKLPYWSASKPLTTVSPLHLYRPPASKFRSSPGHPFFVLRISSAQCHGHFSLETNTSVVLIISPYPSSFGSIRPPTPKHRSSSEALGPSRPHWLVWWTCVPQRLTLPASSLFLSTFRAARLLRLLR